MERVVGPDLRDVSIDPHLWIEDALVPNIAGGCGAMALPKAAGAVRRTAGVPRVETPASRAEVSNACRSKAVSRERMASKTF